MSCPPPPDEPLHDFRPAELEPLTELARRAFRYSRFHMDPEIPRAIADHSRAEWVRNGCLGRADTALVCERAGHPVGFFLALRKERAEGPFAQLDLMAVDPEFQGQGLGRDLTRAFLHYCRRHGVRRGVVGTQAHNLASLRTYEGAGFRIARSFYSFHRHQP